MKNKITLATFNIFNSYDAIKSRQLTGNNIDLLFIQENSEEVDLDGTNFTKPDRTLKNNSNNSQNKTVQVYCSNKISSNITPYNNLEIKHIQTITNIKGAVPRDAIIVKFKDLKIGNIHLEGGRIVDTELKNNFNALLEYKLRLLKEVITNDVDIVLGDFNSVYTSNKEVINDITPDISKYNLDLQQSLIGQYKYYNSNNLKCFKKKSNSNTNTNINNLLVNKWNLEPYKYLIDNGYKSLELDVQPSNHPKITNARGNSIIDTIWYKPNKVKPIGKGKIISQFEKVSDWNNNKNYSIYSDHNPVIGTFKILP